MLAFMSLFCVALLSTLTRSPSKAQHQRRPRTHRVATHKPEPTHLKSEDDGSNHDDSNHGEGTLANSNHGEGTLADSNHGELTLADRGILYPLVVKGIGIWRELSEVSGTVRRGSMPKRGTVQTCYEHF